jgi:hypothetical protein
MRRLDWELSHPRLASVSMPQAIMGIGVLIVLLTTLLSIFDFSGVSLILLASISISFAVGVVFLRSMRRHSLRDIFRRLRFTLNLLIVFGAAVMALGYMAGWHGPP